MSAHIILLPTNQMVDALLKVASDRDEAPKVRLGAVNLIDEALSLKKRIGK